MRKFTITIIISAQNDLIIERVFVMLLIIYSIVAGSSRVSHLCCSGLGQLFEIIKKSYSSNCDIKLGFIQRIKTVVSNNSSNAWFNFFYIEVLYLYIIYCKISLLSVRNDEKIFPNKQVVKIGRSVKFYCEHDKMHHWTFNGSTQLPHNVRIHERNGWSSLRINEANKINSGVYRCFGGYGDRNSVAKGTLKVVGSYLLV